MEIYPLYVRSTIILNKFRAIGFFLGTGDIRLGINYSVLNETKRYE
jgi:hypothetical protein